MEAGGDGDRKAGEGGEGSRKKVAEGERRSPHVGHAATASMALVPRREHARRVVQAMALSFVSPAFGCARPRPPGSRSGFEEFRQRGHTNVSEPLPAALAFTQHPPFPLLGGRLSWRSELQSERAALQAERDGRTRAADDYTKAVAELRAQLDRERDERLKACPATRRCSALVRAGCVSPCFVLRRVALAFVSVR